MESIAKFFLLGYVILIFIGLLIFTASRLWPDAFAAVGTVL